MNWIGTLHLVRVMLRIQMQSKSCVDFDAGRSSIHGNKIADRKQIEGRPIPNGLQGYLAFGFGGTSVDTTEQKPISSSNYRFYNILISTNSRFKNNGNSGKFPSTHRSVSKKKVCRKIIVNSDKYLESYFLTFERLIERSVNEKVSVLFSLSFSKKITNNYT